MQRTRTHDLLLWIAATDSTFEVVELRDGPGLLGKCIHCNAKHALTMSGRPLARSTVEHIVPQCHGGGDDLRNLAIACSRCNGGKGIRHDGKPRDDPKLAALITLLQERRERRWREPLPALVPLLPPLKRQGEAVAGEPSAPERTRRGGRRRGR